MPITLGKILKDENLKFKNSTKSSLIHQTWQFRPPFILYREVDFDISMLTGLSHGGQGMLSVQIKKTSQTITWVQFS